MRGHQRITGFLHTALAAALAFMSLFHGPVMTFAKGAPAHHATSVDHAAHHHGAKPEQRSSDPATMPACDAFGCFLVVQSLPVGLPAAVLNPIGTLLPGIAKTMFAADIEPAIPPPRLQV